MERSISLLRHFKIQTLLKINCCMAAISAFRVTQHSQIFSLFFRNRIQCIALYQLYNSQALLNLRRGCYCKNKGLLQTTLCRAGFNKDDWARILALESCMYFLWLPLFCNMHIIIANRLNRQRSGFELNRKK